MWVSPLDQAAFLTSAMPRASQSSRHCVTETPSTHLLWRGTTCLFRGDGAGGVGEPDPSLIRALTLPSCGQKRFAHSRAWRNPYTAGPRSWKGKERAEFFGRSLLCCPDSLGPFLARQAVSETHAGGIPVMLGQPMPHSDRPAGDIVLRTDSLPSALTGALPAE